MPQRPDDLGPKQKAWCDSRLPVIRRLAPQSVAPHAMPAADGISRGASALRRDQAADELHMSGWL